MPTIGSSLVKKESRQDEPGVGLTTQAGTTGGTTRGATAGRREDWGSDGAGREQPNWGYPLHCP